MFRGMFSANVCTRNKSRSERASDLELGDVGVLYAPTPIWGRLLCCHRRRRPAKHWARQNGPDFYRCNHHDEARNAPSCQVRCRIFRSLYYTGYDRRPAEIRARGGLLGLRL
eukprot:3939088-Rhodomonas_salina.1